MVAAPTLVAGLVFILAACGSSGSSSTPGSSPTSASSSAASLTNVYSVLARYPQAQVQAVLHACASSIRQAFPAGATLTPAQRAERRREAIIFAQCMRSHGINTPDPPTAITGAAAYLSAIKSIDRNSPAYKADQPMCKAQATRAAG